MWLVAPLSIIHFSPPEATSYMRSILGFKSPFLDGSSFVSHKNLRHPNSIFNITIIGTNIFSIDITIIMSEKHIVRIIFPSKIIMCRAGDSGLDEPAGDSRPFDPDTPVSSTFFSFPLSSSHSSYV
jgi:hypothetical protein